MTTPANFPSMLLTLLPEIILAATGASGAVSGTGLEEPRPMLHYAW